ncbi:MAG: Eco57I restriction-modification methylase domain-containing protein [Trebonia sp.]
MSRTPGGVSEEVRKRHAWLELLQVSGPFLTLPVVHRVFPNGLPEVSVQRRATVRTLVAQMMDDRGASRHAVIASVLRDVFDWQQHLVIDDAMPQTLTEIVADHGVTLRPDFGYFDETADDEDGSGAVISDSKSESEITDISGMSEELDDDDPEGDDAEDDDAESSAEGAGSGPWKLLGMVTAWGTHPLTRTTTGTWTANAVERLAVLLRARDVPVGIVTDGRWWALVTAPRGGATGAAVWDASLFSEEPASLAGLVALLTRSRSQAAQPKDKLPKLFAESLERQEEVTEQLGRQVRDAVELLITTLDQLDRESGAALLAGVSDDDFYAGVVTMMMRVVFLLFAEERRLLPSDDNLYVTAYSVGHLVEQLEQADSLGAVLGQRTAAWYRLLALTRAVHSGIAHEDLRLPAYGGGLFDPDRYPWLEGRPDKGTPAAAARPPAVDDRTVLRMLRAVQYVVIGGERRRLTFRALDVEQIGYVYEGLLELEVRTATETVLGLARPSKWPQKIREDAEVTLAGAADLKVKDFTDRTGWSAKRVQAALANPAADAERVGNLQRAVTDPELADRITPFLGLLKFEEFEINGRTVLGDPAIFPAGSRYVTRSHRRAATGTHYTPRSLAEEVAEGALQPLVYRPGPLETSDTAQWRIRPSSQILDLKVADIAMGSGAFLVAACRYLADHLVEAWLAEGDAEALAMDLHRTAGRVGADAEADQLLLKARRRITEHCLYGVDINPLAVEMAKLSLWLITMDTERPFGFLDDRLAAGDSLLGLVSLDQLETLHVDAKEGRRLHHGMLDFAAEWRDKLAQAADLRRKITATGGVTIRDIEHKARLLGQAEKLSGEITTVADAITAAGLANAKLKGKKLDQAFLQLYVSVSNEKDLIPYVEKNLQNPRPAGTVEREPFHWPLAFPEIFADSTTPGFDAIVGNPPFLGGKKISGTLGDDYLAWLQRWDGGGAKGNVDIAARFLLRDDRLLSRRGQLGLVTTNTLIEGDTLEVGMEQVDLTVRAGRSPHPWPTKSANLQIVEVWASRIKPSRSAAYLLDGDEVPAIGPDLEPYGRVRGHPNRLRENEDIAFIGSYVLGSGFVMPRVQADELVARDHRNGEVLQPYVIGRDLNQRPDCSASRWIINFKDWSLGHAEEYPQCLDIVRRLVKPDRELKKALDYRKFWWRYGRRGAAHYEKIEDLDHIIAISLVGNALLPVRVRTGPVFAHACGVFALDDFASVAVLSSNVHSTWVVRYTSTMRTDIRYAPSDVFLTLPRPQPTPELETLGQQLDSTRRDLMLSRAWGLTKTYNQVHDPDVHEPAIVELRDIHVAIDEAVMRAYGWDDLDLKIGHHPTKIGIRWTVSKEARFELLDRLLEENHRRYALENPS